MVGDSSPPSVASKMSSRSASRSRAKATSTGSPCDLRRATRSTSPRETTSRLPPRSRQRRGSRTVPTASGSRSSATLREEPPDHRLGLLVVALADVPVPDDPLPVHEDERGPGPDAEPLPDAEVVVLDDRVSHTELPRRVRDLLVRLLPEELGAVDADDGQPEGLKPLVPRPQLRDHVAAVDSAVGPELDEDHAAAQPLRRQGPTVDPPLPRDVGRGVADPRCLAGCGHAPERSERDEQHDDDEPGTAHGYSFFSIVLSSCVIILSPSTPPWSRSSSRTSAAIVGVAAGRLVNTVRILGEL